MSTATIAVCLIVALVVESLVGIAVAITADHAEPKARVLNPRVRGTNQDATGAQIEAGLDLLKATPPRVDLNSEPVKPGPSPTLRRIPQAGPQPAPAVRPRHKNGQPKGDTTLLFEGLALQAGHPVVEHGPRERIDRGVEA